MRVAAWCLWSSIAVAAASAACRGQVIMGEDGNAGSGGSEPASAPAFVDLDAGTGDGTPSPLCDNTACMQKGASYCVAAPSDASSSMCFCHSLQSACTSQLDPSCACVLAAIAEAGPSACPSPRCAIDRFGWPTVACGALPPPPLAPPSCSPNRACDAVPTCFDGWQYPTACGPATCDPPLGPCPTSECK